MKSRAAAREAAEHAGKHTAGAAREAAEYAGKHAAGATREATERVGVRNAAGVPSEHRRRRRVSGSTPRERTREAAEHAEKCAAGATQRAPGSAEGGDMERNEKTALRDALTEALIGLIRTGGTGSFPRISDKDRVFFKALTELGNTGADEESLGEALKAVQTMRQHLMAPKCAGCAGAPDLSGDYSLASWEQEEREVRALKFLILSGLCALAPAVKARLEEKRHVPELCEQFYHAMFVLGEDFSEEDLLQIAYRLEAMRAACRAL